MIPVAAAASLVLPYCVPTRPGRVVFTSFHGRGYRGNPRVLFEHLLETGRLDPIWLSTQPDIVDELRRKHGAPRAALAHSAAGVWALARARAIVISHGITDLPWLHLHRKALLVQSFHGLPTKKGEYLSSERLSLRARLDLWRRFHAIDLFVSSSPFVSQVYGARFGLPPWTFAETGYPVHDALQARPPRAADPRALWPDAPPFEHVILYAPTFRKADTTRLLPFADHDPADLAAFLEAERALLCLRPHPNDRLDLAALGRVSPRIVVAGHDVLEDAMPLLPASSVVVTDYSAIFLEALLVDRPVVFVPYDRATYERGLCFDYEALTPGPKVERQSEFLEACRAALRRPEAHAEARAMVKRLFFAHDDAGATRRLADLIAARVGG